MAQSSTAAASSKQKAFDSLESKLVLMRPQFMERLPQIIPPNIFIADVLTSIKRNPMLLQCCPISLLGSIVVSAEIGLRLCPLLGHGYLVPFWNSKRRVHEAQFQAGYKGLISLARRSGEVSHIDAELVYDCDPIFSVRLGTNRGIAHEPPPIDHPDHQLRGRLDENGELIGLKGGYATVKYKDGNEDFEYCNLTRLLELRDRSVAFKQGKGPWLTDPAQMFRKVPVRQLAARLPLTSDEGRFQRAAALDELADNELPQNNGAIIQSDKSFADILSGIVQDQAQDLRNKYVMQPQQAAPPPPSRPQPRQRAQPASRQRQQPYRPSNADRSYQEHFDRTHPFSEGAFESPFV